MGLRLWSTDQAALSNLAILGDSAKVIYYQATKQRKEDGFPAVNDSVQREFKNDEREHNKICIVATVRLAAS